MTTGAKSVFLQCMPAGTDGAAKYRDGDSPIVFPLVALWLLLLTEKWDACLDDTAWFKSLVDELIATNGALSAKEQTEFRSGADKIHAALISVPDEWGTIRSVFNDLVRKASAVYGKRPCPGGGTILDIAALKPHPRS